MAFLFPPCLSPSGRKVNEFLGTNLRQIISVDHIYKTSPSAMALIMRETVYSYFRRLKLRVPIPIITAAKAVRIDRLSAMGSWEEPRIRPKPVHGVGDRVKENGA